MHWKALVLGLLLPLSREANAAQGAAQITGIYSDLRSDKETGDLDGTEFLIMFQGSGYFAFYQFWEGGSLPPVVVPVTVKGQEISFSVPAPSGECGFYKGTISVRGFDGACSIPHPAYKLTQVRVHLRRKRSYWDNSK